MKNINRLLACLGVTVACLASISQSAYASVAGHVQFVSGNVQITSPAGQTRPAQKGDAVSEGDTLTSAPSSSAQIKMQDGGFVAVRADTKLKFDEFVFAGKQDGNEKSFFSLFKGGFRAVTGLIGQINKQNYKITTPAATIGIRGTDHETFMITPDSPLALAAPAGAYSKVNVGETFMATEKGTIFVQPNQMGFAGGLNQAPEVLPVNTNIFTVAAAPTAEAKVEKKEDKKDGDKKEGEEPSQDKQAAKSEQNGEESKKSDDTAPVREAAVVDATPPAAGSIPAATTPVMSADTTGMPVFAPIEVLPSTVLTAGGQTVNLTTQTTTTAGGIPVAIMGNIPAYTALNGYGFEALGVDVLGNWINPWDSNLPATSYLLDAANNLVEVVGGISPGKVAGGVAKDTYVAADSSVYFGRWQGGTYTDSLTLIPVAMGNTSMQWVVSANPPLGYVQTLAGITNYSLTAATHPTDKLGNVGTLTAATLSADFTTQIVNISLALAFSTADPTFISTQNKAFSVTTPNGISIFGETIWGLGTVTCTGANCDVGGYSADIWARFAATTANKVAIPYNIVGTTDLVQGVAMVTAATAPAAGINPAVVTTNRYIGLISTIVPVAGGYIEGYGPGAGFTGVGQANTSFVLDGAGNLVKSLSTWYEETPASSVTPQLLTANANVTRTGGVAVETFKTVDNSIYAGRWQGGSMAITDNTAIVPPFTRNLGATSEHWAIMLSPATSFVQTLAGTTTYNKLAATSPTDALGNAGVLNSATLVADFTNQLVSAALNLTIAGKTLDVAPTSMMIVGAAFSTVTQVTATCTGCGSTYYANLGGGFAGDAAANTGLNYTLWTGAAPGAATPATDLIQGIAAFTAATAPMVSPVAPAGAVAPFVQTDKAVAFAQFAGTYLGYNQTSHIFLAAPADIVPLVGAGPGTVTLVDRYSTQGPGGGTRTYTLYGATVGEATMTLANGIQFGRYTSTSADQVITGMINNGAAPGTYPTTFTPVQTHWITGPALDPVYLPEVLLTTGTYTFSGGTIPTSSFGSNASLNSATLSVNFTQQLVSFTLNLMVNTIPWVASSTNAPLELHYWNNGMSGFRADNSIVTPPVIKQGGDLTLTVNGTQVLAGQTVGPVSIVKGQLTGVGLDGALLSYFLNNGSDQITGVAAFTGTAQNTATPYRLVALSAADPAPSANQFPGGVYPVGGMVPIPVVVGGYNNTSSVLMDGAGNLTTFRASNNQILFTATTVGTAVTATGLGTDPVSGISWGRWDNASFKTTEVVSGLVSTNNNLGSAHWIASPQLVGPVTLPVTGTFNYVLAGGTAPTDSLGGVGTLNSASLTANFSAQTVAIGLNVTTPNAGNLIATTANLPIEQGSMFNASTTGAVNTGGIPGSLTITCGAGCAGTPQGGLGGAFAGPGGIGAAVLYGFAAGANNTTIVNGAVAFHR